MRTKQKITTFKKDVYKKSFKDFLKGGKGKKIGTKTKTYKTTRTNSKKANADQALIAGYKDEAKKLEAQKAYEKGKTTRSAIRNISANIANTTANTMAAVSNNQNIAGGITTAQPGRDAGKRSDEDEDDIGDNQGVR